ncbi:hypothetical protein [Solimonas marina]|uniref:Uncharacterized protein n=1 Tax=Solimonas marina TaxID=2714601 RepID=A0A969WDP2_9GAMM|nr:hypothetical protein [Solimonas marina]NKF24304.1 hypothetical protein [Solimonas marina]
MASAVMHRRSIAPARSPAIGRSPGKDCHWQSLKAPAHPAMAAAAGIAGHFVDVRAL